jgi:predicted transcriptional regulator
MKTLFSLALSLSILATATLSAAPDGGPRIRPQDARIKQVLQEGAARSATFKALVDRIEASDVIVYVAVNPLLKSSLAGALTWMTEAGGYRYVRASISSEMLFDQMIATVAHELQHAVEVVEDPNVRDERSLVALYKRIGHQNQLAAPSGWETVAAQETGWQVRRELVSVPASTVARSSEWTRS